jgi:hypothetical protein
MKQGLPDSARSLLAKQTPGDEHPPADLLAGFAERSLTSVEQNKVATHIAACVECREVVFLASAAAPELPELPAEDRTRSHWRWLSWKWVVPAVAAVVIVGAVSVTKILVARHYIGHTVAMNAPSPLADLATNETTAKQAARDRADTSAQNAQKTIEQYSVAPGAPASQPAAVGAPVVAANDLKEMDKRRAPALPVNEAAPVEGPPPGLSKKDEQARQLAAYRAEAKSRSDLSNSLVLQSEARDAEIAPPPPPPTSTIAKAAPPQQAKPAAAKDSAPVEVTSAAPLVQAENADLAAASQEAGAATKSSLTTAAQNSPAAAGLMKAQKHEIMPHWRVTGDGQLQRSVDLNQWTRVLANQSVIFKAVGVIGAQVWAGGSDGALFHSSDGGSIWFKVPLSATDSPEKAAIVSIRFDSPLKGAVKTDAGTTWVTSDGGKSWSKQ